MRLKLYMNTGSHARNALLGTCCALAAIGAITVNMGGEASADLAARTLGLSSSSPLLSGSSSSATGGTTSGSTGSTATTAAQGAATTSTSGTAVLRRFAPLYMGSQQSFTSTQAVQLAKNFNVIADQGGHLTPYMSAMHTANPALKVVAYMNGAFDQSTNGTSYPSAWYARDSSGNRIRSRSFGNWLMDPTSTGWHGAVSNNCTALLKSSHYDGCFLDTLGLGPLMIGYVTGLPVDSATHKVFTATQWIAAQSATVTAAVNGNSGAMVVANGLASGKKYFLSPGGTKPLLAAGHGAMSELWLRISHDSVSAYPAVSDWLLHVKMLVDAEAHGWAVMTTTKLWVSATAAQQAAWHKFTLASFLLGAGGHCAYSFSTAQTTAAISATTSWDTVNVGSPKGAFTQSGGLYERQFSNGLAVVNPGTSSLTVTLPATYTSLSGAQVRSETLPPHSGDVLIG